MRLESSSRRAFVLVAAGVLGAATAVVAGTGVANAAPTVFVNTPADAHSTDFAVPAGTCAIGWTVAGAAGDELEGPARGGLVRTTTRVAADQQFRLRAGSRAVPGSGANGGASGVFAPQQLVLVGRGGQGVDDRDAGGNVTLPSIDPGNSVEGSTGGTDHDDGNGYVSALLIPCPGDVTGLQAQPGDGSVTLTFTAPPGVTTGPGAPTGTEYRVDGGPWTTLHPQVDQGGRATAVVPAVNGTSPVVAVRTTSTAGPSPGVAAAAVTPFAPAGAPTVTAVRTSPSRVTVTWTAPADPGTFPVAGYRVGWAQGGRGETACETPGGTCSFTVPAGEGYRLDVVAVDTAGNAGAPATRAGVTVPGPGVPDAVPAEVDGVLTGPAGPVTSVAAGQTLTLVGTGFAPDSTVQLTVFSSPVSLGRVTTDGTGTFSAGVTLPRDLAAGTHSLVATGIDPDAQTRTLVSTVTVPAGAPAPGLAETGADVAAPLAGGALALLAGVVLLVGVRRRTA